MKLSNFSSFTVLDNRNNIRVIPNNDLQISVMTVRANHERIRFFNLLLRVLSTFLPLDLVLQVLGFKVITFECDLLLDRVQHQMDVPIPSQQVLSDSWSYVSPISFVPTSIGRHKVTVWLAENLVLCHHDWAMGPSMFCSVHAVMTQNLFLDSRVMT
jgi:hypothetical protein